MPLQECWTVLGAEPCSSVGQGSDAPFLVFLPSKEAVMLAKQEFSLSLAPDFFVSPRRLAFTTTSLHRRRESIPKTIFQVRFFFFLLATPIFIFIIFSLRLPSPRPPPLPYFFYSLSLLSFFKCNCSYIFVFVFVPQRVTNPHEAKIGGRIFLGSSGQPLRDMARYTTLGGVLPHLRFRFRCCGRPEWRSLQ